jgi:hypothetical protein
VLRIKTLLIDKPIDVGIILRIPNIAIPGTDYEDGSAQGLDKLDP